MNILKKFKNLSWKNAILFFLIPFIIVIACNFTMDNDIWFLLNHGKYIVTNGIPTIEPFTMHQNFSFVMQQWLSATIFYEVFQIFSIYGLYFLVLIMTGYLLFITYKTCMILSNQNKLASIYISTLMVTMLSRFLVVRPQLFSLSILMTLLFILEKQNDGKSRKYLILLPILSILMINLHASIWFMLFLFILPYLVEQGYFFFKKKENYFFLLLGTTIVTFLVGFINPYGLKAMTYIFSSYGIDVINHSVTEMMVPDITTLLGKTTYFVLFFVYFAYLFYQKEKMTLRHFLFLIGTTYLLLSNYRGQSFFILACIPPLAKHFQDGFKLLKEKKKKKKENLLYTVFVVILFLSIILVPIIKQDVHLESKVEIPTQYILEHETRNLDELKIYTDYNSGGYLEYMGLKPYLDPRAEVFLKKNNGQDDVLKEYYDLERGKIFYQEFRDKYSFDYYIVKEKDFLYPYLEKDETMKKIELDGEYQLFQRI